MGRTDHRIPIILPHSQALPGNAAPRSSASHDVAKATQRHAKERRAGFFLPEAEACPGLQVR